MRRNTLAGILSIISAAVCAQGAPDSQNIRAIRLLPPRVQAVAMRPDPGMQLMKATSLIREKYPHVFDTPVNGSFVVSLVQEAEGRLIESSVTHAESEQQLATVMAMQPLDGASRFTVGFQKNGMIPDGGVSKNQVLVISVTVPAGYDPSRAVTRVHDAVRRAHSDLLLPADAPVLNRLTVLMNEDGSIQKKVQDQLSRDDLRRAPLEDGQFAERLAARLSGMLSVDAAQIGVVGFTYVIEPLAGEAPRNGMPPMRHVLVQYAWPRKPGETGPSAPMTSQAQQVASAFDEGTALRLAEHYFPDAFTGAVAQQGTPTIALSRRGEVIATGRLDYSSGQTHEKVVSEQLVPGISSAAFLSPRLTNTAGRSAVVSFVWSAN